MHIPSQPSLFELAGRPTTRALARGVREAGAAGLPDGVRRGGNTAYQEIACRSALNRVDGMPFRWTLNPYRGCTHGCHYCFARRYQSHLELGAGDDFSSVVLVKTNFAEVLARELSRRSLDGEMVALGTATDPYQPIEGRHRLTRRTLSILIRHSTPVGLITKGTLVVRDTDLLVELSRRARCTVTFSLPTVDIDAWRSLEPGTAHPLQRLRAVRRLRDAGVDAGVLMAPIVPGISSHPAKIERTLKAIADSGELCRCAPAASGGRHPPALSPVPVSRVPATRRRLRPTLRRQARVRFLHHPLPDRHGCAAGETRSAERARAGCRAAACRRNEA
ncbi:MAG: radical SAM protein [Acidobacteria bacterium]|nr:radical SAM protein [Acidobacteriota bacterium]